MCVRLWLIVYLLDNYLNLRRTLHGVTSICVPLQGHDLLLVLHLGETWAAEQRYSQYRYRLIQILKPEPNSLGTARAATSAPAEMKPPT